MSEIKIEEYLSDIIRLAKAYVSKHSHELFLYGDFDDYLQELILAALKGINKWDKTQTKLSTYLYKIFVNCDRMKFRRFRNKPVIISLQNRIENNSVLTYEDIVEDIEWNDSFENNFYIQLLKPFIRKETIEYYFCGKTLLEIAKEENINKNTVRYRINKNIEKLKSLVGGIDESNNRFGKTAKTSNKQINEISQV